MTRIGAAARPNPPARDNLLLFVLATTLVLIGGAQALTPTPAAAMVNEGEECADPTVSFIECETTGGGSGGGTVGSGGSGGGVDGGIGDIVGEVIEVEGTAPPSPCVSCLPSQLGGGQRFGRDGGPSLRAPRRRGRLLRGREMPILTHVTPEDCLKLKSGRLFLPLEKREKEQRAELLTLARKLKVQIRSQELFEEEERGLLWELKRLRFHPSENFKQISKDQWRLRDISESLEVLQPQTAPYFALEKEVLDSPAKAERDAFEKACEGLSSS